MIIEYVENNNVDKKTPLVKFLQDENLTKFMQSRFTLHSADLSAADMKLVNAVANANWENINRHYGLDGHDYTIKIYGEHMKIFEYYCHIDKEQAPLIPLVDFLIDVANLTPRNCYEVSMIDGKYLKPLTNKVSPIFIELPPWMKS